MTESRPDWFSEYFMFMFGTMFAVLITFLGYWWKVTRWYVYAVLVFLSFISYQWLEVSLNISFLIPGAIIVVVGIILLIWFLRRYPKTPVEGMDIGQ